MQEYLNAAKAAAAVVEPQKAAPKGKGKTGEDPATVAAAVATAMAAVKAAVAALPEEDRPVAATAVVVWAALQKASPEYRSVFRRDYSPALAAVLEVPAGVVHQYDKSTGLTSGILGELVEGGILVESWAGRIRAVTLPGLVVQKPSAAAVVELGAEEIRKAAAAFLKK